MAESPGQDGFPWRAVHVAVAGVAPAAAMETHAFAA